MSHLIRSFALLAAVVAGAAGAQPVSDAAVEKMDIVPADYVRRGDRVLWQYTFGDPKSLYLRVQFDKVRLPADGSLLIVIRDAQERELVRYAARDLAGRAELLTGSLYANRIRVQLVGDVAPAEPPFRITRVIHQRDPRGRLEPQSIVPRWLSYPADLGRQSLEYQAIADSVAKLNVGDGWSCSGFLVGPRTLLTNFHCLELSTRFNPATAEGKVDCGDMEAVFDYNQPLPSPDPARSPRCASVADYDQALDYALLVLDSVPAATGGRPRNPLKLVEREARDAETVFVIHHPSGLSKKVSLNCKLSAAPGAADLEHDCDTASGSSGAPMATGDGIVALHFRGAYPEDMTIKQIQEALARGVVFKNRAKPMKDIAARIRSRIQ